MGKREERTNALMMVRGFNHFYLTLLFLLSSSFSIQSASPSVSLLCLIPRLLYILYLPSSQRISYIYYFFLYIDRLDTPFRFYILHPLY